MIQPSELSACSLSATWILSGQNRENPRSKIVTAIALPIFAALDCLICISLTCLIVPVYYLGKDHIRNSVAAIKLFVQSLFGKLPTKFDLRRPYLNSAIPMQHLILRYDLYGKEVVKQQCKKFIHYFYPPDSKLEQAGDFAEHDPEFACSYLKSNVPYDQALCDFIIQYPEVDSNLVQRLIVNCRDKAKIHSVIVNHQRNLWLKAYLIREEFDPKPFYELIVHHDQHDTDKLLKFLNVVVNSKWTDFYVLVAVWDIKLAQEFLLNNLTRDEEFLKFMVAHPNIPADKLPLAKNIFSIHKPEFEEIFKLGLADWLKLYLNTFELASFPKGWFLTLPNSNIGQPLETAKVLIAAKNPLIDEALAKQLVHLGNAPDERNSIKWWINAGISLNLTYNGQTVLLELLRSQQRNFKFVKFLLDRRADPNIGHLEYSSSNESFLKGCSPLFCELYHSTKNNGKESAVDLLIEHQAKFTQKDAGIYKYLNRTVRDNIRSHAENFVNNRLYIIDWLNQR